MGTNGREIEVWSVAASAQIRAERAASGMTQVEVYTQANLSRSTYLRIEKGKHVPDLGELAKIAAVYGLRVPILIERIEARVG